MNEGPMWFINFNVSFHFKFINLNVSLENVLI